MLHFAFFRFALIVLTLAYCAAPTVHAATLTTPAVQAKRLDTVVRLADKDDFASQFGTRLGEKAGSWMGIGVGTATGGYVGFLVAGPGGALLGTVAGGLVGDVIGSLLGEKMAAPRKPPFSPRPYLRKR